MPIGDVLSRLGVGEDPRIVLDVPSGEPPAGLAVTENPATGMPLAGVRLDDAAAYERTVAGAAEAFARWREVPAPVRGQVVRAIGDEYRKRAVEIHFSRR